MGARILAAFAAACNSDVFAPLYFVALLNLSKNTRFCLFSGFSFWLATKRRKRNVKL
jgi:hypothetical protein